MTKLHVSPPPFHIDRQCGESAVQNLRALLKGEAPALPELQDKVFLKTNSWCLRIGPSVPKGNRVNYPGFAYGDGNNRPIAWSDWDHMQQATALAAHLLETNDNEVWPRERLQPLGAGPLEVLPWLPQRHNGLYPAHSGRQGDYYEGSVQDQAHELGFTDEELRGRKPAAAARFGRSKA